MAKRQTKEPLGILDLLRLRGFGTNHRTKMVRHKDRRCDINSFMRNGWFEFYQATQGRPVFDNCERLVSFVGTEGTKARFIGVYRVAKCSKNKVVRPRTFPTEHIGSPQYFYDLQRESGYEDLENRVVVEWGKGAKAWVQKSSNKEVIEILPKGQIRPPFEDYLEFTLTHEELRELCSDEEANREWRSRLAAVAGVYLILSTKTGQQYVGSAYGTKGIWGRWTTYARNGHGGNKNLRDLIRKYPKSYPAAFSYSILQILPKTFAKNEVLLWEQRYKEKLGSRAKGLNAN